jgi:kinetochore protein Spc25, fungi type
MKKKDIEILTLKSATHAQTLQKEAQETAEMQAAIATVTSQRDERATARDRLRQQITDVHKLIAQRQDAQRQHAQYLDSQTRFNLPELEFWQDFLCLHIEGTGEPDHLKFVYTHVNERDWSAEAWFELDAGEREYKVLRCRPKLETDVVEQVVNKLNESRDLGVFLKSMRTLFVQGMK